MNVSQSDNSSCPQPTPADGQIDLSGISGVPLVFHHRGGGHLCFDPRADSKKARVTSSGIISQKKFIIIPKDINADAKHCSNSNRPGSKHEFYGLLNHLIGKEVAIMEAESEKYLGLGARKASKTDSIFRSEFSSKAQYFRIHRTDTGAFTFSVDPKKRLLSNKVLFLHKSGKAASQEMKSPSTGKVEIIDMFSINFSSNVEETSSTNEWVIEPDIILERRESCHHGNVLFLGIVGKSQHNILRSHHFNDVAASWKNLDQFRAVMYSLENQLLDVGRNGVSVHKDYTGSKAKWFAKEASCGNCLCVVITSNEFHQELAEECLDTMNELATSENGIPSKNELAELALDTQIKEVELATAEREPSKNLEETKKAFGALEDVPVSLLHRSGTWLCVDKESSTGQDLLYIEPLGSEIDDDRDEQIRGHADSSLIMTSGDFFRELSNCTQVALRNERGHYLFCKRSTMAGVGKKTGVAGYRELKTCETPEAFLIVQNEVTGAFSIKSASNGLYLQISQRGGLVFTTSRVNEEAPWLIDAVELQSASSEAQLLYAGIIETSDGSIVLSKHAPGRPTAWRTDESKHAMIEEVMEGMGDESSTVVTDSDSGNHWFVSTPDGKKVFVVITTESFPWLFGFKAVMAVEHIYQEKGIFLSPNALYHAMRSTETECKYALEYGNDDLRHLMDQVEELKTVVHANIAEAVKKTESLEAMKDKVEELNEMAEQFYNTAEALPRGKWMAVTAGAVVGGGLVGGTAIAISCVTPAAAPIAGTVALSAIEVCLSAGLASGGAALGGLSGSAYFTGVFSKRRFVKFGRCIDSRRRKRGRNARVSDLNEKRASHGKNMEVLKARIATSCSLARADRALGKMTREIQTAMSKVVRTE